MALNTQTGGGYIPTDLETWKRSDDYHNSFLLAPDEGLEGALARSAAAGLPAIAVSRAQGKLFHLQARALGARRILEVGTLGGYSAIWLARALPAEGGGEVVTLEKSAEHAAVARENIARAGVAARVTVVEGMAAETLGTLGPAGSFDMAFIDADKPSNLVYFEHAKRLVRSGGIIIVDNVCRYGRPADPSQTDPNTEGVRTLLRGIQGDPEVDATTIATVGEKGYDGFLYALRK